MRHCGILTILFSLVLLLGACAPIEEAKQGKDSSEYHYILGVSALREQNPTSALKEFLQAEQFDDQDPEIQAGLAQAYWSKQAYDLAEQHMKRAIVVGHDNPKYHNNLAALYLSLERYDEAIASFRTAADNLLFDRPEMAWTGIGLANFLKQDYPAAQLAYTKALSLNPQYYRATYHLGELYYNQGRHAEALDAFTRMIELAPSLPLGHYWQGLTYMKLQDSEKAQLAFQKVILLAPESENARLSKNYMETLK